MPVDVRAGESGAAPMRRRRGASVLEIALFVPILVTLLVGMIQIGKITYVYYTLRKTLYTMGRFVSVQQGVNFCDDGDLTILAAKNFALNGLSSDDGTDPILPALTTDMVSVSIERIDPSSGAPVACDCSVTGSDPAEAPGAGPLWRHVMMGLLGKSKSTGQANRLLHPAPTKLGASATSAEP